MGKTKGGALALMLVVLCACGGKSGGSHSEGKSKQVRSTTPVTPAESGDPVSTGTEDDTDPGNTAGNVPPQANTFRINLKWLGLSDAQIARLNRAIEMIKRVVATDEFRQKILDAKFVNANGKSNAQVYQAILDAAEKLKPAKDNVMELDIALYTSPKNVLSYTFPGVLKVWFNTRYFNRYDATETAERLMVEWLKKLGFSADASTATLKARTVPCAVGKIVAELARALH